MINPHRDFVEQLLAQDERPDDGNYTEHRAQIQARLQKATRDERFVRLATIIVWGGMLCFYPLALAMRWIAPRGGPPAGFVGDLLFPVATLAVVVCAALSLPLLVLYLVRYRRAVDRARNDARDALILELQQTIEQLKRRLLKGDGNAP